MISWREGFLEYELNSWIKVDLYSLPTQSNMQIESKPFEISQKNKDTLLKLRN